MLHSRQTESLTTYYTIHPWIVLRGAPVCLSVRTSEYDLVWNVKYCFSTPVSNLFESSQTLFRLSVDNYLRIYPFHLTVQILRLEGRMSDVGSQWA